MEEINFKNKYGDTLYGNKWEISLPKFNLVLITGMAEYSARYDEFALYLNENKINVYCLDHYGQGEKNGEKMNPVDDYFFKYIETLKDFNEMIKNKNKELPLINLAHSMGSFILQGYIEKYSYTINKCILIGSNGKNPLVKIGKMLSSVLVHKGNENKKAKLLHKLSIGAYEKSVKNKKSNNEWISFNLENVSKYDNDPLCGINPTNKFYKNFMKGLNSIQKKKNVSKINKDLPILILGGEKDPVGNFSKGLIKLNKMYLSYSLNSTLIIYENMRHEILNEVDNKKVYKDIVEFIYK